MALSSFYHTTLLLTFLSVYLVSHRLGLRQVCKMLKKWGTLDTI